MSTIQYSSTRQQFSVITSSLLQSLRIACSFTVFPSVRIAVLDCSLFRINSFLSVINCREIVLSSYSYSVLRVLRILRLSSY